MRRQRLHEYEKPIALLATQQAELNRDKKKRRKPFEIEEFCLYLNVEDLNLPNKRYGAAAKELIKIGKFPSWALFVYKDLIANCEDAKPPSNIALIGEDCIILAPSINEIECDGMLIALHSASEKIRNLKDLAGNEYKVRMPELLSAVNAIEDSSVRILW